jgi:hypothetical protein
VHQIKPPTRHDPCSPVGGVRGAAAHPISRCRQRWRWWPRPRSERGFELAFGMPAARTLATMVTARPKANHCSGAHSPRVRRGTEPDAEDAGDQGMPTQSGGCPSLTMPVLNELPRLLGARQPASRSPPTAARAPASKRRRRGRNAFRRLQRRRFPSARANGRVRAAAPVALSPRRRSSVRRRRASDA